MAFELKPGQGSLFKNKDKQAETHADYNGTLMLPDGTECWLNAWLKNVNVPGKTPFMSVSVKPKQQQHGDHGGGYRPGSPQDPNAPNPGEGARDLDDEIPF